MNATATGQPPLPASLVVALIKNKFFDEAEEFIEWYLDTFDTDLGHLLPAELEEL